MTKRLIAVSMAIVLLVGIASVNLSGANRNLGLLHQLADSSWTVENRAVDEAYAESIGALTFGPDGLTFFLDSGRIAALGMATSMRPGDPDVVTIENVECELLSDEIMRITWDLGYIGSPETAPMANTVFMSTNQAGRMIWVGHGGIGANGENRVSILTRQ